MASRIGSLVRQATRRVGQPLNILTTCVHERNQSALAGVNALFWMIRGFEGCKNTWQEKYAPLPANHILLDGARGDRQLPEGVDFDLVYCQSNAHYETFLSLARQLQLPMVKIEHTLPLPEWQKPYVDILSSWRGDVNVFISDYNRRVWGYGEDAIVIQHGIDATLFAPAGMERKAHLLSVANDYINRDKFLGFGVWREVTQGLPTQVVGDTPGLSVAARDVHELVSFYQHSQVFLNTSLVSPIPMAVLEAMSCGCAVASMATCSLPEIIIHGVNGLLADSPTELRQHCTTLLGNPTLCQRLGAAARRTIEVDFSLHRFCAQWEDVLRQAAEIRK
jgi:hypothetical protein